MILVAESSVTFNMIGYLHYNTNWRRIYLLGLWTICYSVSAFITGFAVFSSLLLIQALYPSYYNPVHLLAVNERLAGATSTLLPAIVVTISSSLILYGVALQNYKTKAL
ncbi:hypothetical protein CH76_12660 [Lysinibacillus sp. BF-4]|uniref:hypothetical protein n=1 Tax=Lysinibacillus sp. BF-4 TaxID=1473546 RepID=UPI0005016AD5|nr:hypothetical protein [Lysinibacillus sp. BF-4]KFL42392.1 hypothetical protein CH76_12660 [Lysinibacillus sp. BF-4]